jgi:hypothetical protein
MEALSALSGPNGMKPAVADAVAQRATLTGKPPNDFLAKIARTPVDQPLARQRLASFLGGTYANTATDWPQP